MLPERRGVEKPKGPGSMVAGVLGPKSRTRDTGCLVEKGVCRYIDRSRYCVDGPNVRKAFDGRLFIPGMPVRG
jgi:hypothetical protein